MKYVTVNKNRYKIITTMPSNSSSVETKIIEDKTAPDGERIMVKDRGEWYFWRGE